MAKTNPILISRPRRGASPLLPGQPHHGYQVVADRFIAMLEARHVAVRIVESPEQFKSETFAQVHGLGTGAHLHLMFRPVEEMRPIPGAYNIAWFSWSFDALRSDGPTDELVLRDQVRMLRACSEVWVPSHHAKAVLQRYGIDRVCIMPCPIQMPPRATERGRRALRNLELREAAPLVTTIASDPGAFRRFANRFAGPLGTRPRYRQASAGGRIFLIVCNPFDPRKNLATLIEGFLMAATAAGNKDLLIVKLSNSGGMESPAEYLFHQVRPLFGDPHALHEEGVLFLSGTFSDAEMGQLYSGADHYLSASLAEGQNLPLLEAMAHGCVPVAVRNTAMADYIDRVDAIVIDEGRYTGLAPRVSGELSHVRTDNNFADRYRIADAVGRALALDDAARAAMAASARGRIEGRYIPDQIFAAMSARIAETRPDLVPVTSPPEASSAVEREATRRGGRTGWLRKAFSLLD